MGAGYFGKSLLYMAAWALSWSALAKGIGAVVSDMTGRPASRFVGLHLARDGSFGRFWAFSYYFGGILLRVGSPWVPTYFIRRAPVVKEIKRRNGQVQFLKNKRSEEESAKEKWFRMYGRRLVSSACAPTCLSCRDFLYPFPSLIPCRVIHTRSRGRYDCARRSDGLLFWTEARILYVFFRVPRSYCSCRGNNT